MTHQTYIKMTILVVVYTSRTKTSRLYITGVYSSPKAQSTNRRAKGIYVHIDMKNVDKNTISGPIQL